MPQTPPYQPNYAALSINPEYFKEDFSVDAFLVSLTKDVIEPAAKQGGRAATDEAAAKETIERVLQLQKRFARAEDEIALLSHEVTAQLLDLQHGTDQDEQNYKVMAACLSRCCLLSLCLCSLVTCTGSACSAYAANAQGSWAPGNEMDGCNLQHKHQHKHDTCRTPYCTPLACWQRDCMPWTCPCVVCLLSR